MARKKDTDRVPFTPEEIELLKNPPTHEVKDLAFILNRSWSSIRRKRWALLNPEKDKEAGKNYRKKLKEKTNPDDPRQYLIWTKDEEDLILKSKLSDSVLAEKLQRSIGSIQVKRLRLLKKNTEKKKGKRNG